MERRNLVKNKTLKDLAQFRCGMKPDALDKRVSMLRLEDSRKRVISFGSKKAGGVLGIRMLSSYGAADNLWGTEEPKKPTEIVTALGLNDKSLLTIEELLATVLSKADSGDIVREASRLLAKGSNTEKSLILLDNWIKNHWNSFAVDHHTLTRKLRHARNLLTDKEKSIQIQDLVRLIHQKDKMVNNKPIDIEDATLPINMHEVNPSIFARQLTMFYEDYWDKVAPVDLLDPKRQSDPTSPIGTLYDSFNRLTEWVKSVILTELDPAKRKSLIKTFLAICEHLKDLRNFAGLFSVMLGLSSAAVLKVNNHKDRSKYKNLFQILSPAENYRSYRHEVVKEKQFSIPAYVVHSRDLIHTEEISPVNMEGKVNLVGLLSVGKAVWDVYQLKKTEYHVGMRFLQYRNLITLSEDAQWECVKHITLLMGEPAAAPPTPKVITEFLAHSMTVKSVVIDSNELTQERTSPNEEENNPTAAGAPADSNFSQNGREFLVGGGRRNPVLNSIQNKDQVGSAPLSTGTTASTNAIGSAPASDLSPRQQFLRNARQGARTTSVYGANKLEPEAVQQKALPLSPRKVTFPDGSTMAAIDAMMKEQTKTMVKSMDTVIASFTDLKWNMSRESDKLRNLVVSSLGEVIDENNALKSDLDGLKAQLAAMQQQLLIVQQQQQSHPTSATPQRKSVSHQTIGRPKEDKAGNEYLHAEPLPELPKTLSQLLQESPTPQPEPQIPTTEARQEHPEHRTIASPSRRRTTPPSPSQHTRRIINTFEPSPNQQREQGIHPIPIASLDQQDSDHLDPIQLPESVSSFSSPRSQGIMSPRVEKDAAGTRASGLVAGIMQLFRDKDLRGSVKIIGNNGLSNFPDFSNEYEIKEMIDTWRSKENSENSHSDSTACLSSSEPSSSESQPGVQKNSESNATESDPETAIQVPGLNPKIFFSSNPRVSYRLTPLKPDGNYPGMYGYRDILYTTDRKGKGKDDNKAIPRVRRATEATGEGASSGSEDNMLEAGEGEQWSIREGARNTSATLQPPEGMIQTRERKNSVMMIDLRAGSFVPLVLKDKPMTQRRERKGRRQTKVKRAKRSTRKKEPEEKKQGENNCDENQTNMDYLASRTRSKSLPSRSKKSPKPTLTRSTQPEDSESRHTLPEGEPDSTEKPVLRISLKELDDLKSKLAMLGDDEVKDDIQKSSRPKLKLARKHMKKSTSGIVSSPRGKIKRRTEDGVDISPGTSDGAIGSGKDSREKLLRSPSSGKTRAVLTKENSTGSQKPHDAHKAAVVKQSNGPRTRTRSRSLPSIPREDLFPLVQKARKPLPQKPVTAINRSSTGQTGWAQARSRNGSQLAAGGTDSGPKPEGDVPSIRKASFLTSSRSNKIGITASVVVEKQ